MNPRPGLGEGLKDNSSLLRPQKPRSPELGETLDSILSKLLKKWSPRGIKGFVEVTQHTKGSAQDKEGDCR